MPGHLAPVCPRTARLSGAPMPQIHVLAREQCGAAGGPWGGGVGTDDSQAWGVGFEKRVI